MYWPTLFNRFKTRLALRSLRKIGRFTVQLKIRTVAVFVQWLLLSRLFVPEMLERNNWNICLKRYFYTWDQATVFLLLPYVVIQPLLCYGNNSQHFVLCICSSGSEYESFHWNSRPKDPKRPEVCGKYGISAKNLGKQIQGGRRWPWEQHRQAVQGIYVTGDSNVVLIFLFVKLKMATIVAVTFTQVYTGCVFVKAT